MIAFDSVNSYEATSALTVRPGHAQKARVIWTASLPPARWQQITTRLLPPVAQSFCAKAVCALHQ
ncbi:hypothetical protein D3C87_1680360 [compost metagenome]